MGNTITNEKAGLESLGLSNGGMSVLMSVLALSTSDAAKTPWEKRFAVWIAGHDQDVFGLGTVGFDLCAIPWTTQEFDLQKAFVLKSIDMALMRHRWESLWYDPPFIQGQLRVLRGLVEAFQGRFIEPNNNESGSELSFEKCPIHNVYKHTYGCLLCHDMPSQTHDDE